MRNVLPKFPVKKRRAVSQIMGSIVILGIVSSVGSVILFNGMNSISAFTYDLSFHEKSKNQIHREDIIFEHIRFVPGTDDIAIDLSNIGTVDSTVSNVTILKIDTQEIIANWVDLEETILTKDHKQILLDGSDIVLTTGSQIWDDDYYEFSEYRISLTSTKGNFFTTVASPFNT